MTLKVLTINCNKAYVSGLEDFLNRIFAEGKYDFILLQELRSRKLPSFDPLMTNILGSYTLIRAFNDKVNSWSEIGLVYRKDFKLEESKFYPFPPFTKYLGISLPEFGLLIGTFITPEGAVTVGSVHMHSDFNFLTRKREARFIKRILLNDKYSDMPIIFGGDFNNGLPGEKLLHDKIFKPEFVNTTKHSGPTVDSKYLEPSNPINTFIIQILKFFKIRLRMKVDHIYADSKTADTHTIKCIVLPDRISDHSPLEVILR